MTEGRSFLSEPNNIGLSLNVDSFRPFKHSPYSVGVIYFVLLNLPQKIRYLPDHVIVAGIIPGPRAEFHGLYQQCTINMHLACHLRECILDFGPFHAFWCYAFERMNGHLGSFPTNHLNIEVQLMRRFVEGVVLLNY